MGAILIHNQYGTISLFLLMTCAIIISTSFTLLLVTGWHTRTYYYCKYADWYVLMCWNYRSHHQIYWEME